MVLKRLLMTALGVLGMGALATGPAVAQDQGQVPAPRLYADITACAGGMLPVSPTAMGSMSALNMALDDPRTGAVADIDTEQREELNGQLMLNSDACVANPIAGAYNQAVAVYNEYVAAKAALPGADEDPDADATARYNQAKATKEAFDGPVFDEVFMQQMDAIAVEDAIDDYNELVGTDGALAVLQTSYNGIMVDNLGEGTNNAGEDDDDPSWSRIYGSMGVRGYQAIEETAFDAAGVLQIEEDASTTVTNLGQIATALEGWQDMVDTAQDVLDDAIEDGGENLSPLREDLRQKTNARNHVQGELSRLSSIIRAQSRNITDVTIGSGADEETLAEDEREVLAEYGKIQTQVDTAAAKVTSTVRSLEQNNNDLQDALLSPEDYLDQLVKLRQHQKDNADAAVEDAGEDPAPSLVAAATEAAEALTMATSQRDAHTALTGDSDSPASALLSALLEPEMKDGESNPADDDGRALIDAISDTYDVAKGAETTAEEAKNSVEGLGGDDGRVAVNERNIQANTDKNAEQDATLADHDMKLMLKKKYIENLGAHIGVDPVTGLGTGENGMSRIDMNQHRSVTNAGDIEAQGLRITANEGAISMNSGAIADNMNSIGSNSSAISDNRNMIGELSESLEVVRAGVAASMALAGMPSINGRGVSIGVGSFDGESAFAIGFQIQSESTSFKVGVTSGGGATGASAGVGFQF